MPYTISDEDKASAKDEVVAGLSDGIPLAEICRREGMPSRGTIYAWQAEDAAFAERFARAREEGFDVIAEDALAIADDGRNDWVERHGDDDENAGWRLNGEHVQRSKLRIETRLKLLAKWSPKYADKLAHIGGAPGDPAIAHAIDISDWTDEQKRFAASFKLAGEE